MKLKASYTQEGVTVESEYETDCNDDGVCAVVARDMAIMCRRAVGGIKVEEHRRLVERGKNAMKSRDK